MKRFEVGSRVVEPTYGLGSVIAVEDAYTRVQFDEHGVKKFLTSMSRLEPSSEPVPVGLREVLGGRTEVRPYFFRETDIPSPEGATIVVQSDG
jgi:RNA polymerase-interacting CarD/CdnL/TRCF family regulator